MGFEKTMMGNPTGEEKPRNASKRIGGNDFGESMGAMYQKASEHKETTAEKASRLRREMEMENERQMRALNAQKNAAPLPSLLSKEIESRPRKQVLIAKAPTPEEIAAYQAEKKEADEMEKKIKKGGILSRLSNFFGGN